MLTRSEFIESLVKKLEKNIGKENVNFTNDLKREELEIIDEDRKASPFIPVDSYYESYSNGTSVENLSGDINEIFSLFDEKFDMNIS